MKMISKVLSISASFLLVGIAVAVRPQVTWLNVEMFVGTNATYVHADTIPAMKAEKAQGVKTWVVFGTSLANRGKPDNSGVGWPSTGKVIYFATPAEASICGSMIDAIQ
ncbi:MAG: hypothetical protein CBB60_005450 [Armatimonadetes bacterium Cent15-Ar3]|nr:MAG: hypothetical protein CBB60_005450 [Armatimonadetes bacterium Cent15-Ar3]